MLTIMLTELQRVTTSNRGTFIIIFCARSSWRADGLRSSLHTVRHNSIKGLFNIFNASFTANCRICAPHRTPLIFNVLGLNLSLNSSSVSL